MLVTFRTPASGNVTLFGHIAVDFIRLMGHSGAVPGAIAAEDVPAALERLRRALASGIAAQPTGRTPEQGETPDDEVEDPVPMGHRAVPLLALLQRAADAGEYVIWGED